MFGQLAPILLPVFICAGIGYSWGRSQQPFNFDFVTVLVTNVAAPCLVFSALTTLQITPAALGEMFLAGLAALASFIAVGTIVLVLARQPLRVFLPAVTFPNAGNLGLPLALFAFGDEGLALAVAYFAILSVAQFTLGVWIASGEAQPWHLLRAPVLYATVASLIFLIAGTTPPSWLSNTTGLLGGAAIPLLLLSLGVALARLEVRALPISIGLSVLRLGAGLGIAFTVAKLLALGPLASSILMLQSAMPSAVLNYLFAERYGNNPEKVAGVVLISTFISFATLPALLMLVL